MKGTALDRRLRFGLTVFQQDYKNLAIQVANVPYLGNTGVVSRGINTAADARIRGLEFELAGNPADNLDFTLSGAYAKGKIRNDDLLCRDSNGDGIADGGLVGTNQAGLTNENSAPTATLNPAGFLNSATPIRTCRSNGSTNSIPKFTGTLQSEYRVPFDRHEGYVRVLASYRSKATNEQTGFVANDYFTLNLFTGVRLNQVADISIFARNLLNKSQQLSLNNTGAINLGQPQQTGYFETTSIVPREFGLSVRVQWGSR